MTGLTDEQLDALERFSEEGNALAEAGQHADALPKLLGSIRCSTRTANSV